MSFLAMFDLRSNLFYFSIFLNQYNFPFLYYIDAAEITQIMQKEPSRKKKQKTIIAIKTKIL